MKCGSCNIEINKEFKVAISKNVCPACGNIILASGNLAAFVPLCDFLISQLPTIMDQTMQAENIEKLATLLITNFNISAKSAAVGKNTTIEVVEDGPNSAIDANGILFEKLDKNKTQEILHKMREEALDGALNERYGAGLGDDNEVLLSEDPKANAALLKQRQKQIDAQKLITEGGSAKGGFRRSA